MKRFVYISVFMILFGTTICSAQVKTDSVLSVRFHGESLKKVLSLISENYGIRFSYSDNNIPVDKKIYGTYSGNTIYIIISDILEKEQIGSKSIDNHIVLFSKKHRFFTISGKVINEIDGQPIPYVSIGLEGSSYGTSSNAEGEFVLKVNEFPARLAFHHLTFEKKTIVVDSMEENQTILLNPLPKMLEEVTVKGKRGRYYYDLIEKAYALLQSSSRNFQYGKAFYRQKTKRNNDYTELFEIFYDVKYTKSEIIDWSVLEGRYAMQNTNNDDIFVYNKNYTLLSRLLTIKQPDTEAYITPVNEHVKDYFVIELEELIKSEERLVAVLTYYPKRDIQLPAFSGKLFIDVDTYDILRIEGSILNTDLKMIDFKDGRNTISDYSINLEISFKDQGEQLVMDYVNINHSFKYYFDKVYKGDIYTSSILNFYEHYFPNKEKKFQGRIDFNVSDVYIISKRRYNPDFWAENPVIKRTPLEEKLIEDFNSSSSFAPIFLNNSDEIVFIKEDFGVGESDQIIEKLKQRYPNPSRQKIYVSLDRNHYLPGSELNFKAYLINRWNNKPSYFGSILYVELQEPNGTIISKNKFDLNYGIAIGSITIPAISNSGRYVLCAYTNMDKTNMFSTVLNVEGLDLEKRMGEYLKLYVEPEGGHLVTGLNNKVVIRVHDAFNLPYEGIWKVKNAKNDSIGNFTTNHFGLGSFKIIPEEGEVYYVETNLNDKKMRFDLPDHSREDILLSLSNERENSLGLHLENLDSLLKEDIYIACSSQNKVFSLAKRTVLNTSLDLDLPLNYIPGGSNSIYILTKEGEILSARNLFVNKIPKLDVNLVSATGNKKSNKINLTYKIGDSDTEDISTLAFRFTPLNHEKNVVESAGLLTYMMLDENEFEEVGNIVTEILGECENLCASDHLDNLLLTVRKRNNKNCNSGTSSNVTVGLKEEEQNNDLTAEINKTGYNVNCIVRDSDQIISTLKIPEYNNGKSKENEIIWMPVVEVNGQREAHIKLKNIIWNNEYLLEFEGISETGLLIQYRQIVKPSALLKLRN